MKLQKLFEIAIVIVAELVVVAEVAIGMGLWEHMIEGFAEMTMQMAHY